MTKKRHQSIISLPKVVTIGALAVIATLTIDFGRRALDNYHVQRQVEWLEKRWPARRRRMRRCKRIWRT